MRSQLTNLFIALQCLREQKQRAALSAMGIMVGCTAILLLVSIATGVKADITGQVKDLGVNLLIVVPGRLDEGTFNPNFAGESYLKEQDAASLGKVPGVVRAEPFSFLGGGIRYKTKEAFPLLAAVTPGWFSLRPTTLDEGRLLTASDSSADVAVIGSVAKDQLFGKTTALGKKITINGREYAVIGVTHDKKQGEHTMFSFGTLENLVYVPFARLKHVQPEMQVNRIFVQSAPEVEPKALLKKLDAVLVKRLDRQQFQVLTQDDLLGLVYKVMGILTWLLTGLTSIALFVAGVGIMTVMLMAVSERAKEIGVRKAAGAKRSDIFFQFLFEALALAVIGATAGLLISLVVIQLLARFTPIKPLMTPQIVLLSFGVSAVVGGVFGLIPANHAAKKDPVAALRME